MQKERQMNAQGVIFQLTLPLQLHISAYLYPFIKQPFQHNEQSAE
jgi:hypothetical protein